MLPNPYTVALYAHVLVVVYLLGADLGRLLLARAGAAAGASPDTQLAAARTFSTLGSVTGTALILILPVGISLAGSLGVYRIISPAWLISTWVVTGAWLLLSVAADRAAGNPAGGGGLLLADGIARFVIGAGHLYDGAIAFAGTSQTVEARWLAAKITLFGVLILLSIPVRRTGFAIPGSTLKGVADSIVQAWKDPAACQRVTQRARRLVERRYAWDLTVKAFDRLYWG